MTTTRTRLPLLVERDLADTQVSRIDLERRFLTRVFRDGPIMCSAGCAHCCYHPRYISPFEGILLFRGLVGSGKWTPKLKDRVVNHAKLTAQLSMHVWYLSTIACPLLDEKTRKCGAYNTRPLVCRLTVSRGDPEQCHPHRYDSRRELPQVPTDAGDLAEFRQAEEKRHKMQGIRISLGTISQSLLVAEQIETGAIPLDKVDLHMYLLAQG